MNLQKEREEKEREKKKEKKKKKGQVWSLTLQSAIICISSTTKPPYANVQSIILGTTLGRKVPATPVT